MPDFSRDCMTSATPSRSFGSSPGTAKARTCSGFLPHLSTYLGHARIRDTQRYLSMTTELLEQASICFEQYARPEAPHV